MGLKSKFCEWASITTVHGVPDLASSPVIFIGLIWAAVLSAAIFGTGYQSKSLIEEYLNDDVLSSTVPMEKIDITNTTDVFTLQYCNKYWMDYDKVAKIVQSDLRDDKEIYCSLQMIYRLLPNANLKNWGMFEGYFCDKWYQNESTIDELWKMSKDFMGERQQSVVQFLTEYAFRHDYEPHTTHKGWTVVNGLLCQLIDPAPIHFTHETQRYFHKPVVRYLLKQQKNKLPALNTLEDKTDESELSDWIAKNSLYYSATLTPFSRMKPAFTFKQLPNPEVGAISTYDVIRRNQQKDQKMMDSSMGGEDEKVYYADYYKYTVNVLKTDAKNRNKVPCQLPPENSRIRSPVTYNKHECIQNCMESVTLEHPSAGCQVVDVEKSTEWKNQAKRPCLYTVVDNNAQMFGNYSDIDKLLGNQDFVTNVDNCIDQQNCESTESCTTWKYSFQKSPGLEYIEFEPNDIADDDNYEFVRFDFYLKNVEIKKESLKVTFTTLLSGIGGLLGFFTGASIISFIQLVVFCLKACFGKNSSAVV